ncbi:hypothetical protein [Laspinema olomoucense]|uniref:Uncharacterized protein n=1 Tax=Laspinema olomoucense D3b TaxID=2953688 RepID=A0ABT2N8K3_9CYAN|nr:MULTISPECIES: hypothetical protein [unclassified Laspinema]MCT7979027.1 hypothetical protein [Laspinema sp. D3b]MCT7987604.1 hypothetical protein [Laspinema sp. D3a]
MSLSTEQQIEQQIEQQKKQQIELKIQKGIRRFEDDLVKCIQSALDQKIYGNLEESQFRNVLRVAETTDSAEVVKNFLRYQMGRDDKWGKGKDSLAEKIINDIDRLIQDSKDIATKANATEPEKYKDIHIELIRRYLGYGSRYLRYKKSLNKSSK